MNSNNLQLQRAFSQLIIVGPIVEVSTDPIGYKIALDDDRTSNLLQPLVTNASANIEWRPLAEGEQVVAVQFGNGGFILGSLYQQTHPAPSTSPDIFERQFNDGTYIKYDTTAKHLKFYCAGTVAGRANELELTAKLTLNGDLIHNGKLTQIGDQSIDGKITSTGDQVANGISLTQHVHDGVMSGPAKTGLPQ